MLLGTGTSTYSMVPVVPSSESVLQSGHPSQAAARQSDAQAGERRVKQRRRTGWPPFSVRARGRTTDAPAPNGGFCRQGLAAPRRAQGLSPGRRIGQTREAISPQSPADAWGQCRPGRAGPDPRVVPAGPGPFRAGPRIQSNGPAPGVETGPSPAQPARGPAHRNPPGRPLPPPPRQLKPTRRATAHRLAEAPRHACSSGHACHGARLPRVESRAARRLVSEMILLGLPLGGHGRRDAGAPLGSSKGTRNNPGLTVWLTDPELGV